MTRTYHPRPVLRRACYCGCGQYYESVRSNRKYYNDACRLRQWLRDERRKNGEERPSPLGVG